MNALIGIKDYFWAAIVIGLLALASSQYVGKTHIASTLAAYRLEVAQATAQQNAKARDKEHELAATNERLNDELAKKAKLLAARDAAARRSDAGLRDEITRLNARPAPENPQARAFSDEARAARELLGACSDEYRGVALKADELRDQVMGLREYVQKIVQPGQ